MYKPKSKYKTLYSSGGEFVYSYNRRLSFKGAYIETSEGRYFEGTTLSPLGDQEEIVKQSEQPPRSIQETDNSKTKLVYDNLKPKIYKFHKETKPLVATKQIPTSDDYKKGKYKRYFAKRRNTLRGFIEINKEMCDSIKNKEEKYDHHLYIVDDINWNLKEGLENKIIVTRKEIKYPGLSVLFQNENEFILPIEITQTVTDVIDEQKEKEEKESALAKQSNVGLYPQPKTTKPNIDLPTDGISDIHQQMMREVRDKLRKRTPKTKRKKRISPIKNILQRAKQRSSKTTRGGGGY
jgi:hypothetical protein